jgi:hypothetical protein
VPLQLLVLALDAALYPTLLAAVVILLSQPRRLPLLASYLAGGLTISIAAGLGIIAVLKSTGSVPSSRSGSSWITDLSVGGLALLLAVALATRADERFKERYRARHPGKRVDPDAETEKNEPLSQRILARGSVPIVFIAALAVNLPGAAYLVALKDITAAHHPTGADIALVVAFNLVMFLLAEIPLLGLLLAPDRTVELVHRANQWFAANGRQIAISLCTVLGVFLIVRGIVAS